MARYAIEVCGPHNEKLLFQPLRRSLRGRIDAHKFAHRDLSEALKKVAQECPSIPGQQIVIDTDRKIGLLYDPLGDARNIEGKRIADKLSRISGSFQHVFGGQWSQFQEPIEVDLSIDDLKDWLWNMLTAVKCGLAVQSPQSDALPDIEEVERKMPGKVKADPGNENKRGKERYFHEVEPSRNGSGSTGKKRGRPAGSKSGDDSGSAGATAGTSGNASEKEPLSPQA